MINLLTFLEVFFIFTWEDRADVSPDDKVEHGVNEQHPAQPTERGCVTD